MSTVQECAVRELELRPGIRAVRIENDLVAATILVDKGADIYELIYKPKAVDVLWKSPWRLRSAGVGFPSAFQSATAWLENYPGGWQEIFPSGGGPCVYKGVELSFHGEASSRAWDFDLMEEDGAAEVRLAVRLARSPFRLERVMRVEAGSPALLVRERITNEGGEPMDYMWGHHPAFGAPFLSAACRIDTNARALIADDAYDGDANPVAPGQRYVWPTAERDARTVDLAIVPSEDEQRIILGYFADYEGDDAWFGVTNQALQFGVGMVWPRANFPFAWFWQEMHASGGFPWYRGAYVMAIEPSTSYPGQGLVSVMEKTQTHRTLEPGETAEAELRTVFYDGVARVTGIDRTGRIQRRESTS